MKPQLTLLICFFGAMLFGSCCQDPKPEVIPVIEPIVVERIVPDASLEAKLKACEALSAARLDGWRKAEARYKHYETYWQPKAYGNGGPQNGPVPPRAGPAG